MPLSPQFKKTKFRTELTNFCPISVLPVLSTVLECVVYGQLISYFLQNDLFSDCQSEFHPNYVISSDVLLHVTDSWRRAIDDGKFTTVAFLDISKAFDSVNHDLLLSKLACYGTLGNSLTWLQKSYHVISNKFVYKGHHFNGVK